MSFNVGAAGPIAEVRKTLHEATYRDYGIHGRSRRLAETAIHAELDHLEGLGATHVNVTAHGHSHIGGGTFNVSVTRDTAAEEEHRLVSEGAAFDHWHTSGVTAGFLKDNPAGPTVLSVPPRSTQNMHRKPSDEKAEGKPEAMKSSG